jgi:DNA-binding NarL/FixJ family response regulator
MRPPGQSRYGYPYGIHHPGAGQCTAMGANVLIVDDHSGFRACARGLLESEGYRVIGEAADCASALQAARSLEPELALVDVHLPDGDGVELSSRLRRLAVQPAVILISSRDGAEIEPCVEECGALGFVPKSELSGAAVRELFR